MALTTALVIYCKSFVEENYAFRSFWRSIGFEGVYGASGAVLSGGVAGRWACFGN
jgi:hypothetical protein